ncbi:zinc-ribbon domain-containing protein [Roseicella aquatilis]|nr:zinc-ribbon domain-containing protein [Roseicella aquatilis]
MRIICPTCGAAYEVPDHLAVPGRSLRCRKCGHAWRLPPGEEAPAESEGPAAPPEAPRAASPPLAAAVPLPPIAAMRGAPAMEAPPPQAPAMEGSEWPLRLAWAASILAVLGLVLALWVFRVEIVAAWPPAARLYLIFGRTPPG